MRAIILAQGAQRRLKNSISVRKQCLPVLDELLIQRTVRLLREAGVHELHLVGWSNIWPVLAQEPIACVELKDPGQCILDGMHAARTLWDRAEEPFLFILGDVVFSRVALFDTVARASTDKLFFAATPDLGPGSGEVFAMGVGSKEAGYFHAMLATVPCRQQQEESTPYQCGHLRNLLWHIMDERSLSPNCPPAAYHSSLVLPITDWTDDIDTPADVQNLGELEQRVLADRRAVAAGLCRDLR